MVDVREVNKNVYSIDDHLYSIPKAGSVYFLNEKKKALVDTGPATSARVVLEGIQRIGFTGRDIDYIILTHIHLDHGGGAGTLLKEFPKAKVVAHYKAKKHLLDPSKLIRSAIEAQGKESAVKNGEVLPIEEQRILSAYDNNLIKLSSEQVLTLMDCPGHAPHELCIYENRSKGIFVGDAVGHYIDGTDIMIPVTPPPSFDLELYLQTLNRLIKLNASAIYFPHSGTSNQVQEKLETAIRKLQARDELIAKLNAENRLDTAVERVTNHICSELEQLKKEMRPLYDEWANNDIRMSVVEHVRYYKKRHGLSG